MSAATDNSLWPRPLIHAVAVTNAAVAVTIAAAAVRTSPTAEHQPDLIWMEIGLVALVASGVANGTLLLTGRRAIGLAMREQRSRIRLTAPTRQQMSVEAVVLSGGDHRYVHHPGCRLIVGRSLDGGSLETLLATGHDPCPICRPDDGNGCDG